jgi:hypothetical protein
MSSKHANIVNVYAAMAAIESGVAKAADSGMLIASHVGDENGFSAGHSQHRSAVELGLDCSKKNSRPPH